MAARRIIVAMPKGGSGKTATAFAFACGLEAAGKRVLLVDLDPLGSATAALGAFPTDGRTAADLLGPGRRLDPIRVSAGLHIIPSPGDGSVDAAFERARRLVGPKALRESLARVDGYDYVICDCGPSLAPTTYAALAAGPVLVPVETTRLTVAALPRLARAIAELRRAGTPVSILACLPTRHVAGLTESREALVALRALGRASVLDTVIPQSTAVARSLAEGISLFDPRYRASRAPSAYLAAIDEVVSRLEERHE